MLWVSISVFWLFWVSIRLFLISGKSFLDDFEVGEGRGMGELWGVVYGDCFFDDGFWFWFDGFIVE